MGAEACAGNTSVVWLHLKQKVKDNFAAGYHTMTFCCSLQNFCLLTSPSETCAKWLCQGHRGHCDYFCLIFQTKNTNIRRATSFMLASVKDTNLNDNHTVLLRTPPPHSHQTVGLGWSHVPRSSSLHFLVMHRQIFQCMSPYEGMNFFFLAHDTDTSSPQPKFLASDIIETSVLSFASNSITTNDDLCYRMREKGRRMEVKNGNKTYMAIGETLLRNS